MYEGLASCKEIEEYEICIRQDLEVKLWVSVLRIFDKGIFVTILFIYNWPSNNFKMENNNL